MLWLDLRLRGIDPESMDPNLRSLLLSHAARDRDLRYNETMLLMGTIVAAVNAAVSGKSENKLQEVVKEYTALTYPESDNDTQDKAANVQKLLEKEFARGPMKVQSQEYSRRKKKNPR